MKNFLRSIQTLFPSLHDFRFTLKFFKMNATKKPHESDFLALKKFNPEKDDVFIDVGSNRGEAICSMLLTGKFDNEIIGFEPNALVFEKLKKRFGDNKRITLHNTGLGNSKEQKSLFVPFYRNWMFDGLSSFNYSDASEWLKTRLWNYSEDKLTVKEVPCELIQLDSFNFKPFFIKIDVQGFELEVLKGAENTLSAHHPILLIESISEEVIAFLKPLGYELYTFKNNEFIQGKGALNTFCMNQKDVTSLKKSKS